MNDIKYKGLKSTEIANLQAKYGLNQVDKQKTTSIFKKLILVFKRPATLILLITSILLLFLDETRDAIIIILMVFLGTVLDFVQEYRVDKASKKLAKKLSTYCTVIRDGIKQKIETKNLVPGDIIFLAIGDIIPADCEVLEIDSFTCNESVLTGESFPIEKDIKAIILAGTNVVSGWAFAKVIAIGLQTKFGSIAKNLTKEETKNAFAKGIDNFGILIAKLITFVVILVILIILIKGLFNNKSFGYDEIIKIFLFAVTIAVGLTPELLPIISSLTLARGSLHMNKRGVLVKKLNAIPDFGSMDVLCTDKTGTLTEDRITLVKNIDIFGNNSNKVFLSGYYNSYFQSGLKNPLDEAILKLKTVNIDKIKKIDEIPYDFKRKKLSVILEDNDKNLVCYTKGQPEEIFKMCHKYENSDLEVKEITTNIVSKVKNIYDNLSKEGYRVLAVCYKKIDSLKVFTPNDENEMILLGLLVFLDPPKITAKTALDKIKKHNIQIKIITGDNELVTTKVCQELNIEYSGVITGDQLQNLDNTKFADMVEKNHIFARVNPNDKQKIIKQLKQNGHIVGYMGDGINDSLSLKESDIGISVENAVDIAKESADIILLEKDLNCLIDGVIEGRKTFGNTQKYMFMSLSSNFGNILSMVGASIFLPFLPMLPTQILFNNLLYDISQVGIPLDNVDQEYILSPKKWDLGFMKKFMLIFGPISSIFDFLTFYLMFNILKLDESGFQSSWFLESLATQILVIFVIRTRLLPFIQSFPGKYLILSTLGMLLIGIIVVFSPIGSYFNFQPLNLKIGLIIFALVIVYLTLVEFVKKWFYSHYNFKLSKKTA